MEALNHGHRDMYPGWHTKPSVVISPLPHTYINASTLPKSWDIRNLNGKSLATDNRNQHIPQYCGSCWAHGTRVRASNVRSCAGAVLAGVGAFFWRRDIIAAATSALSDRINILRGGATPFVHLAPQVIVNCATGASNFSGMNASHGCNGGDTFGAYAYMAAAGVPDESCQNYEATGDGTQCTPANICRNCAPGKGCWAVEHPPLYYVEEHGLPPPPCDPPSPVPCVILVPKVHRDLRRSRAWRGKHDG
jgi:cathepsin X